MTSANPIIILDDETLAHFRKLIAKRSAIATHEAPQNGRTDIGQCLVDSGYSHPDCGYKVMTVNGKSVYLHRMALMAELEFEETGKHCAHACDRRKCFNVDHLRFATASDNALDRWRYGVAVRKPVAVKVVKSVRVSEPKSIRFRGVNLHKASGRWRACIQDNGCQRYLGYSDTAIGAARLWNDSARQQNAENRNLKRPYRLNDIPEI